MADAKSLERAPFKGLRVVDLSDRLSGAFAARLFGDFGAEVLLVECPEGHCLRHEPPFADGSAILEQSVLHAYFNWNKDSVVANSLRDQLDLAATADVVITTSVESEYLNSIADALPLDCVHLSVTPHGLTDPLTDIPGNNLTMSARSGWASINRYRDEAPLALPRDQAGIVGGVAGFIAAAAAHRRCAHVDHAERVDVSELEAYALTVHPWGVAAVYHGADGTRGPGGGRRRGDPAPLWDLSDGQMNLGLADFHNWTAAMEACNLPEIGARPNLIPDFGRHSQDMRDVVWGLAETLPKLKRWDVFHKLAKLRCVIGVVQDADDLLKNEHLNAREYFVEAGMNGRSVRASGAPAKLHPVPWAVYRVAPPFDTRSLATAKARRRSPTLPTKQLSPQALCDGPLADVRVLSFGQAWSGTFGTELLALLGADVVQIASIHRPDAFRRISNRVPQGVFDDSRTQHPANTQGHYNSVNLHKREIALDLRADRGREILWGLLPRFDMVVDNFRPNVLPSWGITLERLHEIRPGMIWASISGYGESGPYSQYPANGATTEPMAGLSSLHGYEGDTAAMNTGGLYPDPISGYFLVATILAAMSHRDATGEPQRIDLSMLEAVATSIGDAVLEMESTGQVPRARGNHHPRYAPHYVYPTVDKDWLALAAETDQEWARLVDLVGDERLLASKFATGVDRKRNEQELDGLLSEWTSTHSAFALEQELIKRKLCGARIVPLAEIYSKPDEHFAVSGFVDLIEHPEAGPTYLPGRPWRLSGAASTPIRPAPCVGQHSQEVFTEELGMNESEYLALVAAGITGTLDEYHATKAA